MYFCIIMRKSFRLHLLSALCCAMLMLGATSCTRHKCDISDISTPIDSLMASVFADDEPGGIIIVSHNDSVIYEYANGIARFDTGKEICRNTVFNLGPATKLFTAVAILKLVEEDKLALSDPLSKFFPNLPEKIFSKITLRHVLQATTGLPDGRPLNDSVWQNYLTKHPSIFSHDRDYSLYGQEDEFTEFYTTLDSTTAIPGTHVETASQNPPYLLLSKVIEQVSNEDFEHWMKRNVFDPSGMKNVFYVRRDWSDPTLAHAYRPAAESDVPKASLSPNGLWAEYDYGEMPFFLTKADNGLFADAESYLAFRKSLLNGEILSPAYVDTLYNADIVEKGSPIRYALAVARDNTPGQTPKFFTRGTNGGFVAIYAYFPDKKINYIIFANRNNWDYDIVAEKLEAILRAKNLI